MNDHPIGDLIQRAQRSWRQAVAEGDEGARFLPETPQEAQEWLDYRPESNVIDPPTPTDHFIVWSANDDSEAVCDCGVHMRAVTVGAGGMPSAQRMQNRTLGEVIAEHFIRSKQ